MKNQELQSSYTQKTEKLLHLPIDNCVLRYVECRVAQYIFHRSADSLHSFFNANYFDLCTSIRRHIINRFCLLQTYPM